MGATPEDFRSSRAIAARAAEMASVSRAADSGAVKASVLRTSTASLIRVNGQAVIRISRKARAYTRRIQVPQEGVRTPCGRKQSARQHELIIMVHV